MRHGLTVAAALLLLLGGVLVVRTAGLGSRQLERRVVPDLGAVDRGGLVQRLAEGLRFRTVSHRDPERLDGDAFRAFHAYLERAFPRVHLHLERERIAGYSLLYTWKGNDASLDPVLLAAHLDVVPVEEASRSDWTHSPFGGQVSQGFVWGRGAIDDKGSLFSILEAVESLLAGGETPRRTVYLAFGHDEEVGGERGAGSIAARLAAQGVRLAWVLDEGGVVGEGMVDLLPGPLALVGVAEKGAVTASLRAELAGGHSSVPPRQTAVGVLSAAVQALERNPMPARLTEPTRLFFAFLAPELGLPLRTVLANLWLFGGALEAFMTRDPSLAAMVRTTTAATVFRGGVKANVLPRRAEALVNFRILPGDTVQGVLAHVRRTVDDERIEITTSGNVREPSPISPVDSDAFATLQRAIGRVFPDATVVPFLVLGGTDARHYLPLGANVYRFLPFLVGREAMRLAHGVDERVSVENLVRAVRFYRALLRDA